MSGYDDIEIPSTGNKYLKVEASKPVTINVITKSDEMVKESYHWDGKKYIKCNENSCDLCLAGSQKSPRYKINVFDRDDSTVKIYEFGTNIIIGMREIAKVLKEDGQTIHDVDLRISRISEKPVRYSVIQRKKAGPLPDDLKLYDLNEERVPF